MTYYSKKTIKGEGPVAIRIIKKEGHQKKIIISKAGGVKKMRSGKTEVGTG